MRLLTDRMMLLLIDLGGTGDLNKACCVTL